MDKPLTLMLPLALPSASGGALTPRPVVDIALEGLDVAPVACLLDTGALRTRMSAELAPLAGIELTGGLIKNVVVRAAFLAAREDARLGTGLLRRAATLELEDMGRVVRAA